jgi:hypothetical protein
MTPESRRHHFVPKFLLRPWLVGEPAGHLDLRGCWWNHQRNQLDQKIRGLNSFCYQIDLLSLQAHNLGRDAIERVFFGEVDTKGAIARDALLQNGPAGLSVDQRCDFARLLLSLDIRRPRTIDSIRAKGRTHIAKELDTDDAILAAMSEAGIGGSPSSYIENHLGWCLEDRALSVIQRLVDNRAVGHRLINAYWHVKRLGAGEGTLVLADRPLIRVHGYDRPGATWILPLTPEAAFIACNAIENLQRLTRLSGQRFAKELNKSSAAQAERFVFCKDDSYKNWLGRHLKRNSCAAPRELMRAGSAGGTGALAPDSCAEEGVGDRFEPEALT